MHGTFCKGIKRLLVNSLPTATQRPRNILSKEQSIGGDTFAPSQQKMPLQRSFWPINQRKIDVKDDRPGFVFAAQALLGMDWRNPECLNIAPLSYG